MTLPHEAMRQLFKAQPANDLPGVPNYNVCPTTQIHAVRTDDASRRLVSMRWGFLPRWYKSPSDGPLLINARSETIAQKPAFRDAVRARRCLIPCTGFYEWTKTPEGERLPWYITRADKQPMVFAGIWQNWGQGAEAAATCAIVTCAAAGPVAQIHSRMPVVLAPEDWALWLGEEGKGAAVLMRPAPVEALQFHRVGKAVNSNRASGEDLIGLIAEE